MVDVDHPVEGDQRVMETDLHHPGAESDVLGALRGHGQEHLRSGDRLPTGRVMLANPRLGVPEPVEMGDEVEVALQGRCRIFAGMVQRLEKEAESQSGRTVTVSPIDAAGIASRILGIYSHRR